MLRNPAFWATNNTERFQFSWNNGFSNYGNNERKIIGSALPDFEMNFINSFYLKDLVLVVST